MNRKIAFIVSKFPCYDEAFILREISALSKRYDITIFSLRKSKEKIIHREAGPLLEKTLYVPYLFSRRIFRAQARVFLRHPLRYLAALIDVIAGNRESLEFLLKGLVFFPKAVYFADWAERREIGHVHAYWATYPASAATAVSKITGIPFSFTGHAHDIFLDTTNLREKMKRAAFMSTCTRQNKVYLQDLAPHLPAEKILVNYHGLELQRFHVKEKKRNPIFQILSVGTLHPHKGFNYLIHALGILKQKGLDFQATIIGGGPLEADLKRHIKLLGLESRMTMTGPLKQDDILPYYQRADLTVLMAQPEWHWGIPNVLIESLAAKTPVITTHFGSVEELVRHTETGWIVPPKDAEELARAIERLYADDSLRCSLAHAGHQLVLEHFDLDKNIENFCLRFFPEEVLDETVPALVAQ